MSLAAAPSAIVAPVAAPRLPIWSAGKPIKIAALDTAPVVPPVAVAPAKLDQPNAAAKPDKPGHYRTPGDPLEGLNRALFGIHQALDKAIFRPLAMGYKTIVPKPVRGGVRHFFANLTEPVVFVNDVLQLRIGRAAKTVARFVVNSTIGVGGLIDVAKTKDFKLPYRPNGFSDTLAIYGVKTGPYLFIPLLGPSTFRDLIGGQADGLLLPVVVGRPFDQDEYQIPKTVLTGLDLRAEHDDELRALFDSALDPYATLRSAYLQSRQGEIDELRGKSSVPADASGLDDPLADPAGSVPSANPTAPSSSELSDPMTDPTATPSPPPAAPMPPTEAPTPQPQ